MNRNTFFTSDFHIGHEAVMKFCKRPFKDLHDMHCQLIKRYNNTVKKYDVCYFIGDIGMGRSDVLKNVIYQLNGIKILILGNHDNKTNTMYQAGFDAVMYGATLKIVNQQVTLAHCPLRDTYREDTRGMRGGENNPNWHGENKHGAIYSIPNWGQFHLHGHIHSSQNRNTSQKILGRQFDVGVDANNYTPVSIRTIETWIQKTLHQEQLDSEKEK